jgi:hypothetical protein
LSNAQFKPICRENWANATDEIKEKYKTKASEDRERYEKEMDAWVPSDEEDAEFVEGRDERRLKKKAALPDSDGASSQEEEEERVPKRKAQPQPALAPVPRQADDSSSEDVPLWQIYAQRFNAAKKAVVSTPKKRSEPPVDVDGEASDDSAKRLKPPDEEGRAFSAAEDASLREAYQELREREPRELGRLLSVRVSWDAPVTHAQIAQRLLALQLIDDARFREINESRK